MCRRVFAWLPVALCVMAAPALADTGTRGTPGADDGKGAAQAAPVKPAPAKTGPAKTAPAKPAPRPRRAPQKGDWTDRGYLFVNVLLETGGSATAQSQSWPYFAETATATVDYPGKSAAGFDASGGYRVWRNLAVGAGVTIVSRSTTADYSGAIPNPLYLNRPNLVSGTFPASESETAIHLQVAWGIPVSPRMLVLLFAGPSIFSVNRTVMQPQGLAISAGYPFDSTAAVVTTRDTPKTAVGFGVGADVSYYLSKTVGVGGMIRFDRATADIPISGQPSVGVTAGGFQVAGGLRIRFAQPKPKTAKPVTPAPKPASKTPKKAGL